MRTSTLVLSLICLASTPEWARGEPAIAPATSAPPPRGTGIELEFRSGYGLPAGRATGDQRGALSDRFTGVVPIGFGAGYRFHPRVSVGLFLQHGVTFINGEPGAWTEPCSRPGFGCSGSLFRWGAGVRVHLVPNGHIDPWLGAGVGYEEMSIDAHSVDALGQQSERHWTASGLEFANLELGTDFRVLGMFTIGAYVTVSVAHYSQQTVRYPVAGQRSLVGGTMDIPSDAIHEWIMFGLRLSYLLRLQAEGRPRG